MDHKGLKTEEIMNTKIVVPFLVMLSLSCVTFAQSDPLSIPDEQVRRKEIGQDVPRGMQFRLLIDFMLSVPEPFFDKKMPHLPYDQREAYRQFLQNAEQKAKDEASEKRLDLLCPAGKPHPKDDDAFLALRYADDVSRDIHQKHYLAVLDEFGPRVFDDLNNWLDELSSGTFSVSLDHKKHYEAKNMDVNEVLTEICTLAGRL